MNYCPSSGLSEGAGASEAAGHAAQGGHAQDHLPATLVPGQAGAEALREHETRRRAPSGKLNTSGHCLVPALIMTQLLEEMTAAEMVNICLRWPSV